MKFFLFTVDLEEFDSVKEENNCSERGFKELYKLIKKNNIKTTFFVTLSFARDNPQIIRDLIKDGHEIACHAYRHSDRYNKMGGDESFKLLSLAKKGLERRFKVSVEGFRAPQMSYPDYSVLKKVGFSYDSSLHPTILPGFHNELNRSRKIEKREGIKIIPISTVPFLRLPFSWLWFRNLGLLYTKICSGLCYVFDDYVNVYFHPWDFCDLKDQKIDIGSNGLINFLFVKNTGEKALSNLDKYFRWVNKKGIKSITIKEYLGK